MARRVDIVLGEILDAISLVEEAVDGFDQAGFADARFLQRGVERSLEIISEAVRHLPDDVLALEPEIDWAGVRGIGNLMRHEYWRVDPGYIWSVVRDDLPPLRAAVENLFRQIKT